MTTSALPQQGHRDGLRAETIPEEDQLALAEGTYLPDWPPATRQCRNSLGLNTYDDMKPMYRVQSDALVYLWWFITSRESPGGRYLLVNPLRDPLYAGVTKKFH